MSESTREERTAAVATAMRMFNYVWPGKVMLEDATFVIWEEFLREFPAAVIGIAARHLIATRVNAWPPTVAEMRDACINITLGRLCAPTAQEAWLEALCCIRTQGNLTALHPLIRRTVEYLGGLKHLGESTDQDRDRIAFVRAFEAFQGAARLRRMTTPEVLTLVEVQRKFLPARKEPHGQ